jgi:Histone methylation protein DOT1
LEDNEDFFLSESQTQNLLKLARVGRRDVFYDLGCGDGLVVCMAVSHGHAKKAIGVESKRDNFERACDLAVDRLSKSQLKKVNFWFAYLEDDIRDGDNNLVYDYRDATVVYHSLEERDDDVRFYRKRFAKEVKIIRKDLPLVGYAPVAANRDDPDCWFFMHRYKLDKVKSKEEWARLVLGQGDSNIKDVRAYLRNQLEKRDIVEEDIQSSLKDFNRLARSRFLTEMSRCSLGHLKL